MLNLREEITRKPSSTTHRQSISSKTPSITRIGALVIWPWDNTRMLSMMEKPPFNWTRTLERLTLRLGEGTR